MRNVGPLIALLTAGCAVQPAEDLEWLELPEHFPAPVLPADNPLTPERADLGRHLFYDTRLSGNGRIACSSCHRQESAFADPRALSVGATGERGHLNAPSLANAAYMNPLTWSHLDTATIEEQLLGPMFGEAPIEMGMRGFEDAILERLRSAPVYRQLYPRAFPDAAAEMTLTHVRLALASFVRTILSYRSPFDDFIAGDAAALSASQARGADLFFSPRLGCGGCHGGFALTSATLSRASSGLRITPFHNIGLYNVGGRGDYPPHAPGLSAHTGEEGDRGRFRVPSLRNVALTAPYMHDGSVDTLEEVIRIYEAGGRNVEAGEYAGDGRESPLRSSDLPDFELTATERSDLLAFLEALSDRQLLEDPRHSNPW